MSKVICPSCGKQTAIATALPMYQYRESGIPNLWLRGGVTETKCSSCRKRHIRIERESQLLQVIALGLLIAPRPLAGSEMRFLRGACQMSQGDLAAALYHRRETISERESKKTPDISFAEEVTLRQILLDRFQKHLSEHDFLSAEHRRVLATFTDFFRRFSSSYVREYKSSKLIAALDGDWKFAKAA